MIIYPDVRITIHRHLLNATVSASPALLVQLWRYLRMKVTVSWAILYSLLIAVHFNIENEAKAAAAAKFEHELNHSKIFR